MEELALDKGSNAGGQGTRAPPPNFINHKKRRNEIIGKSGKWRFDEKIKIDPRLPSFDFGSIEKKLLF